MYPEQVSIVKYEEVAKKPKTTLPILLKVKKEIRKTKQNKIRKVEAKQGFNYFSLQFLGLPWHPSLTKFMADHMVEDAK